MFGNRWLSIHFLRGIGGLDLVAISVHLISKPYGWRRFFSCPGPFTSLKANLWLDNQTVRDNRMPGKCVVCPGKH